MFACQLQHRQKVHHQHRRAFRRIEHVDEFDKSAAVAQAAENDAHVLAYRQFLALNHVPRVQLGLFQDRRPRVFQILRIDVGQTLEHGFLDPYFDPVEIALSLRQLVQLVRRQLHLLIFNQPAYQLGTRVFFLFAF